MVRPRTTRRRPLKKTRPNRRTIRWDQAVILDYATLMARPDVERIGLGWKETNGKIRRRMSVKIYVRRKVRRPKQSLCLPKWAFILIPTSKDLYRRRRVPTDVIWYRDAEFCALPTEFMDPIKGGAMMAVPGREAGTFACMVQDAAGQPFALTAGHVIQAVAGPVATNVAVKQPAGNKGVPPGSSAIVGRTAGGFFGNLDSGFRDFALIRLNGRTGSSLPLDGLAGGTGVLDPALVVGSRVSITKFGAVTGRTRASFVTLLPSLVVNGVNATNIFEFVGVGGTLVGQRGDSGALVVSTSPGSAGSIVGLLFATSGPAPDAPFGRAFVFPFNRISGLRPL